jgi:nucleotide-binding universal stress UspA family protein
MEPWFYGQSANGWLLGSVARAVVTYAHCPVMVVK